MRAVQRIAAWLAGAILLAPATATAARLEGEVVASFEKLLLVRSQGAQHVFQCVPGATFVGVDGPDAVRDGDVVRISWSRELRGIKQAEVVEEDSSVWGLPEHRMPITMLLERGRAWPLLIDLRSAAAYAAGHLPGAVSLPPERIGTLANLVRGASAPVVFYGASAASREPVDALRRALALGVKEPMYLEGGVREWVREERPLVVTPEVFARSAAEPRTVIDVRERDRALAGTVPGAISWPRSGWRWQDFAVKRNLAPIVLVGEEVGDPEVLAAAEQIRAWSALSGVKTSARRIRILDGGWKAWSAGGRAVTRGERVPTELRFTPVEGEVDREAFLAALAADPGARGPFPLDVAHGSAPRWGANMRLDELAGRLGELPRDREIWVYCTVGRRAAIARAILEANGFRARFLNGVL